MSDTNKDEFHKERKNAYLSLSVMNLIGSYKCACEKSKPCFIL